MFQDDIGFPREEGELVKLSTSRVLHRLPWSDARIPLIRVHNKGYEYAKTVEAKVKMLLKMQIDPETGATDSVVIVPWLGQQETDVFVIDTAKVRDAALRALGLKPKEPEELVDGSGKQWVFISGATASRERDLR